jgi:hypothetical protein
LIAVSAQCVHTGDDLREFHAVDREPRGRVGNDADEEVGSEERAEDHDLRDDEKQHAEHRWLDA